MKRWYHGTTQAFGEFCPEPLAVAHRCAHWNTLLGIAHFTARPQTANFFAGGGYRAPEEGGRVIMVHLDLKRPFHYSGENDLAAHALLAAYMQGVLLSGDVLDLVRDHTFLPDRKRSDPRRPDYLELDYEAFAEQWIEAPLQHRHLGAFLEREYGRTTTSGRRHHPLTRMIAEVAINEWGQRLAEQEQDRQSDEEEAPDPQRSEHMRLAGWREIAQALEHDVRALGYDSITYANSAKHERGLAAIPFDIRQIQAPWAITPARTPQCTPAPSAPDRKGAHHARP